MKWTSPNDFPKIWTHPPFQNKISSARFDKIYLLFISELRVAFAMFDQDGDGSITSKELVGVMTSLGVDTSTNQVKAMIRKVDLDGKCRE